MKSILLFACLVFVRAAAYSQEAKFVGSEVRLENAVRKAEAVYLGRFVTSGYRDLGPSGCFRYNDADLQIIEALVGELPAPALVKASYLVRSFPAEEVEAPPKTGVEYILFVANVGTTLGLNKILPATAENLAQVRSYSAEIARLHVDSSGIPTKLLPLGVVRSPRSQPPLEQRDQTAPALNPIKDTSFVLTQLRFSFGIVVTAVALAFGLYVVWLRRRRRMIP